jgi:hypothetical protein
MLQMGDSSDFCQNRTPVDKMRGDIPRSFKTLLEETRGLTDYKQSNQ